jgi:hypothetical protein
LAKFWLLQVAVAVDTPLFQVAQVAAAVLVDIAQMQHFRWLHHLQSQSGGVVMAAHRQHRATHPLWQLSLHRVAEEDRQIFQLVAVA